MIKLIGKEGLDVAWSEREKITTVGMLRQQADCLQVARDRPRAAVSCSQTPGK
jgi:hypothetical protein